MLRRVIRFKDLPARPKPGAGIVPKAIIDFLTATENYNYLAPAMDATSIIQRNAALQGGDAGDAISLSLAVCKPGDGPALHAHRNTVEAFFCLSGRFAISWGDRGEQSVDLEEWDFILIPKGIVRTFTNIGDADGALLVIIQGMHGEFDDVVNPPYVAEQITKLFGPQALTQMQATGRTFEGYFSGAPVNS